MDNNKKTFKLTFNDSAEGVVAVKYIKAVASTEDLLNWVDSVLWNVDSNIRIDIEEVDKIDLMEF